MSQLNQNAMQPQNNSGKKTAQILYWVIIAILLGACIFLFMGKNEMTQKFDQLSKDSQTKIDSMKTDRASLQSDFDAASAKIDQLTTQNTKLNGDLEERKAEIEKIQAQIKTILKKENADKNELKKARDMINRLTDKTKQYEERIAQLEKENTNLKNENQVVTKERDSTVSQVIAIKKIGSALNADNIRMEPIHKRKNGKEKETKKAKKVDVLRIKFDIIENHIAESGTKQLYIRMIAPDKTILSNPTNGSGMFSSSNNSQLSYSVEKDINLVKEQPVKDITVDWNQDGDYQRGVYAIEIYSEGYVVGTGNVTLK